MSPTKWRNSARSPVKKVNNSPARNRFRSSPIKKLKSPLKGSQRGTPIRSSTPKPSTSTPTHSAKKVLKLNFDEAEQSLNKSWAEIVEEDSLQSVSKSEPSVNRRKTTVPKKSCTKPKFIRTIETLEFAESLYGSNKRSERFTRGCATAPRPARCERKRRLSGSGEFGVNEGSPKKAARIDSGSKPGTPKRLDLPSSEEFRLKDFWEEPTLGWCTDVRILEKRTKDIEKAKEKPTYVRYLSELPKSQRSKQDPKTPNKFINYSRRSWDTLMRKWKRSVFEWCGEEPTPSCNSSFCGDTSASEADLLSDVESVDENRVIPLEQDDIKTNMRFEPDAVASLLGRFDIDTQTAPTMMSDESTLKGTSRNTLGPKDFSGGIN